MPTPSELIRKNQDLILVIGVVGILIAIFVPLPTPVVDLLLTTNIMLSLVILFTAMYVKEALDFGVFPTALLVTTAFRLALNIATTRLILSNAPTAGTRAAGRVIETFGNFVAGNNIVIGVVIFLILVIIQFIVITKGAGRISEVAARFVLDAMPGKQMSIDADLNAGLIKEGEARQRRERIGREADFYGAMDGAMKFVRGDAIAGIVISFVNIVAGFIIGVLQGGMTLKTAAGTYTLLTIGDGLVTQIPALIISLGAGMIVTRSSTEGELGREFLGQMFGSPKVLYVSAGLLAALSVTGLPFLPMVTMAGLLVFIGRQLTATKTETAKAEKVRVEKETAKVPEKVETLLHVDPMELEIGYGLIRMVDPAQGGTLLDRVTAIRRQLAHDLGVVIPPVRIRDNMQLEPAHYVIKIRGTPIASGTILVDHQLAMDSGATAGAVEGVDTKEPAFGLPAKWIPEAQRQRAESLGWTVVDPTTVLSTHLTETIKAHAHEILSRDEVSHLIKTLKESHPSIVEEVVPGVMKIGEVQKVLQNLLREGVSIRDLGTILETLGDFAPKTKDPEILTEYVRNGLARSICQQVQEKDGRIYVITLDPRLEDLVRNAVERTEGGSFLSLPPATLTRITERLAQAVEKLVAQGHSPVILCGPQIRSQVKRIADTIQAGISVLSYNEVVKELKVESGGMVPVVE